MSPNEAASILSALNRLEDKIDAKADKEDITRLERKVDATNGRVTALEKREIQHNAYEEANDTLRSTIWRAAVAGVASAAAIVSATFILIDHL